MAARCPLIIFLCVTCGLLTAGASPVNKHGQAQEGCPEGWTLFESRCFKFFTDKVIWIDAEYACIKVGGNLASVHSDADNEFVRSLTIKATGQVQHVWIGGLDAVKEGVWLWTDGSEFDYVKWYTGEPNNANIEHCLLTNWVDKFWNDGQCGWTLPFICSKRLAPKTH